MSINRSIAPDLGELIPNPFALPEIKIFKNGCALSHFNVGSKDYLYFHLIFMAGRIHSDAKLIAELSIEGILSGTSKKSAADIASALEFYGCFIESEAMDEYAVIKIHVLRKHAEQVLQIIKDCIQNVSYPISEFESICLRKKSQLQVLLKRGEILTSRALRNHMFGDTHPFGRLSQPEDYSIDLREICISFYKQRLAVGPSQIILGGPADERLISLIEELWGSEIQDTSEDVLQHSFQTKPERRMHIELENSVQSSIRLGMFLPNLDHPDSDLIKLCNLVLSGSFGSRLMQALREEKGYTYGVYSAHYTRRGLSWLDISMDTDIQYVNPAIEEINHVLKRLISEPPESEELFILRNNYIGNMLRKGDGIIGLVNLYTTSVIQKTPFNDFVRFSETCKEFSGIDIANASVKYLDFEHFTIITCH